VVWPIGFLVSAAWMTWAFFRAAGDPYFAAAVSYRRHDPDGIQRYARLMTKGNPVAGVAVVLSVSIVFPLPLYRAVRTLWNWRNHRRPVPSNA
jgi:hypothetical protein